MSTRLLLHMFQISFRCVLCIILIAFLLTMCILLILLSKSPLFDDTIYSITDEVSALFGCYPCTTILDPTSYSNLFSVARNDSTTPTIDIVITWAGLNHFDSSIESIANRKKNRNARIRNDNYEIKYCLRSIYQHIPWFHRIFLVVNDQTFDDIMSANKTIIDSSTLKHHRLSVINLVDLYCSIYSQCDALDGNTNSDSIETVLHRIPGLADYYLYFNDDFMIGRPLHWTFFFAQRSQGDRPQFDDKALVPRMPYILYQTYSHNANNWYFNLWNLLFADTETYERVFAIILVAVLLFCAMTRDSLSVIELKKTENFTKCCHVLVLRQLTVCKL